jgi:alpha-L-fucosidase 2
MNKYFLKWLILFSVGMYPALSQNILWYKKPAESWESQALPIGNGRLGGMVFGQIKEDRIQLNEESIWTGNPSRTDKEGGGLFLKQVRNLLFKGEYARPRPSWKKICKGREDGTPTRP